MATIPFDPEEAAAALDEDLLFLLRVTALEVSNQLIQRTPVGNPTLWARAGAPAGYVGGHARRNWQMGVNVAPINELQGQDASGGRPRSEIQKRIKRIKDPFGSVFVVNNVPYAARLADGHSTQAPSGWVDAAILDGLQNADRESGREGVDVPPSKRVKPKRQRDARGRFL